MNVTDVKRSNSKQFVNTYSTSNEVTILIKFLASASFRLIWLSRVAIYLQEIWIILINEMKVSNLFNWKFGVWECMFIPQRSDFGIA